MKTLRLILGDQLNPNHSWFDSVQDNCCYLMMETRQEATYTTHHHQKLVAFFAAMRQFSQQLIESGHRVEYLTISDPANRQDFEKNLREWIDSEKFERFEYQEPDEYRLDRLLKSFTSELSIEHEMVSSEHFYTERAELAQFFEGKKSLIMESFYRHMRKKHSVLMKNGEPEGGSWNYDEENRSPWKKGTSIPAHLEFGNEVGAIVEEIEKLKIPTMGKAVKKSLNYPINREQAHKLLDHFIEERLSWFGKFQDALFDGDPYLFHSRLSFALNCKMITPREVVNRVIAAYENATDQYPLAAIEGFVRQVIGWREFMRGIYWKEMPDFKQLNYFNHKRSLPEYYWTGDTQMNCLRHAIGQSLETAYAHHIQRLMITGNFALLAGINPDEVDAWYLGIYADAIEWVQLPNTRGMSQFADGGIVGTKPYISSANYINKMGNYCADCKYDHNSKTDENSCPFNSLYWHFYDRHRDQLESNRRVGVMYSTLDRMKPDTRESILRKATEYLDQIENL